MHRSPIGSHSAIEAAATAAKVAERTASVLTLKMTGDIVKLIARDEHNEIVLYTECSSADATRITAILSAGRPPLDVEDVVDAYVASGMDLIEAINAARLSVAP